MIDRVGIAVERVNWFSTYRVLAAVGGRGDGMGRRVLPMRRRAASPVWLDVYMWETERRELNGQLRA